MRILSNLVSNMLTLYRRLFLRNNAIRRGVELYNVNLSSNINISRNSFVSNSKIDEYSTIGRNTTIINAEIGKFCSISWNVTIGATRHNFTLLSTHAFPYIKHFGFSFLTIFTSFLLCASFRTLYLVLSSTSHQ